jgi:hypothetical protein
MPSSSSSKDKGTIIIIRQRMRRTGLLGSLRQGEIRRATQQTWAINQMSRKALGISLSIGVVLLIFGGLVSAFSKSELLPPLLQGIKVDQFPPTNRPLGEFGQRLARRFPIGSPEAALVRELWLEGFRPETALDAPERRADFVRLGNLSDLARRDAYVSWTADSEGKLTSISGYYVAEIS